MKVLTINAVFLLLLAISNYSCKKQPVRKQEDSQESIGPNLVGNPGLEDGTLEPWVVWKPADGGTPEVTQTDSHTGQYAIKLGGGISSIEQQVSGLKPWTRYVLNAWVKVGHAGDSITLGVKNFQGAASATVKVKETAYKLYTIPFTTGGSNTSASVYLVLSDAVSAAYGDDFELKELAAEDAQTYYIDDSNGDDANDGKSQNTAWRTLEKVNAQIFFPGDRVLFKKGGHWIGTLQPKGEGVDNKKIVLSSYGSGEDKPLFDGNGALHTIYLVNQQYWDIDGLEVMNTANPGQKKRGITIENTDRGVLNGISIINNYVHDILGDNDKGQNGSMGIMLVVRKKDYGQVPSWFNDVLIADNVVKNVRRTGIGSSSDWRCRPEWGCDYGTGYYPTTKLVIRNNYVENAGGDGIVPMTTDGALVEHNVVNGANVYSNKTANAGIWCWGSDRTVFQYNEVYNVKTAIDGEAYDVDVAQDSTVFQYNYSHDNEGGFMLLCSNVIGSTKNAIVRYNVSQNDKYRIIMLNGCVTNAHIYNNTMYLPEGSTTGPIVVEDWSGSTAYPSNIYVKNNIFHLASAGPWMRWDSITGDRVFDHNIVFGTHTAGEPAGNNNLTSDPLLVAPNTGTSGGWMNGVLTFGNVDGYKLRAGSPAIAAGVAIPSNGGKDYWDNPVPSGASPNIGAYEGQGQ